jgi:Flp pilus assembly protein TadD
MRLGDKQGAIADFRKALELRPGLPSAREALQKLGAL